MRLPFSSPQDTKVICMKCKKPVSLKITSEFTTEKCDCGVIIWYPPKHDRLYGTRTIITKEEYDKNYTTTKEGENIKKSKLERTLKVEK